ncbi:MAG: CBS domain-containing protein [Myxococcota bacterium]
MTTETRGNGNHHAAGTGVASYLTTPQFHAGKLPVTELMTTDVVSVPQNVGVREFVKVMLEQDLHRMPVVDDDGKLVGIISRSDLMAHGIALDEAYEPRTVPISPGLLPGGMRAQVRNLDTATAQDVMSPALALEPTATVAQAAELMVLQHVHGLPIVSKERRVVGWVSALDVLGWVAGLV